MSRRCRAECLSGERHREEIREESGEGKRGDKVTAESVEEDWQQRRLQRRGGKGGWRGAGKWQPRRVEGSGQVAVKEVESISKIVLFFFFEFWSSAQFVLEPK